MPEEREVFANLTVDENLRMGEQPRRADAPFWTVEQMFDYFPRLNGAAPAPATCRAASSRC